MLKLLADGEFHSGQKVADYLGVSRTAVWKKIQQLRELTGIDVHAVQGRGYRLPRPVELLDETQLRKAMSAPSAGQLVSLHLFEQLESTNQFLLDREAIGDQGFEVCLAEIQTQGRGRRGRQWLSSFGGGLQFSLGLQLAMPMSALSGLSIAVGVAMAEYLDSLGVNEVALKWPNDVHIRQQKLAGILIEIRGESDGPVKTVIGVGLNLELPDSLSNSIEQPVTSLHRHLPGTMSRNAIAGGLISRIHAALIEFNASGLDGFVRRWERFDCHRDEAVMITTAAGETAGICRGLHASGGLLLENELGLQVITGGEVSLRKSREQA